jgi:thiol-disulfide isomerase/thioredoxin
MPKYPTKSSSARVQQPQIGVSRSAQRQHNKRKVRRRSNRGPWLLIGGVLVALVAVIGIFIYLSAQSSSGAGSTYPATPANPTVVKEVTNVASPVLAAVGTGSGQVQNPPTAISGSPPLLTGPNGKPEVFYDGGEYCPFCAAERWGMIVALSRFGTFHNLSQTSSSSSDIYPSTPTFSFYHSSYTSQYLDFVSLEEQSYQGTILQQPTAAEKQLITSYNGGGSIPFVDIANRYSLSGASYSPQVLSNLDWQSIADTLSNPQSPVTQAIVGTANYLTAAICQATNQQPASVCQAAPVPQIEQALTPSTGKSRDPRQGIAVALVAVVRTSRFTLPGA